MPSQAKKQTGKQVFVTRPFGPDGPSITTVKTDRLTAVFRDRIPLVVTTSFDPPEALTKMPTTGHWWTGLMPLLRQELGDDWFDGSVSAANDNNEPTVPSAARSKLLTLISAWWAMTRMSNSHATFDEFLTMAASKAPEAHRLGDELMLRLATLTADLLDRFPEAVLSAETTEFIDALVSMMEGEV